MREIADRFIAGVVAGARRAATSATRSSWTTEVGPMSSREQFETVRELVDDAVAAGATLRVRRARSTCPGLRGPFYAPAVLTGVTHDMRIMREEIFGPVLPIMAVDSEDEAIDARQRLAVRPRRLGVDARPRTGRARSARELQSGMVWINDHMYSHGACQCSWGGVKDSGLGRAHSKFGFYECVERQAAGLGARLGPRLLVASLRRDRSAAGHPLRGELLYGRARPIARAPCARARSRC